MTAARLAPVACVAVLLAIGTVLGPPAEPAVAGIHQPDGENGKSEHVLWLIDAAARKLVRTVGLPSRIGGNNQKVRVSADGTRVFVEYEGDVQVIDGKTGDELIRHKGRIN